MLQQKFNEIGEIIAEAVRNGNYKLEAKTATYNTDWLDVYIYIDDVDKAMLNCGVCKKNGLITWFKNEWLRDYVDKEIQSLLIDKVLADYNADEVTRLENQIAEAQKRLAELKGGEQ